MTADIPGAFLQTNQANDDEIIICINGTMEETLENIDPKVYQNKMIDRNRKNIIYTKDQKAIYRTLCAAFYSRTTSPINYQVHTGWDSHPISMIHAPWTRWSMKSYNSLACGWP